jgi:hypothetical protein
MKTTKRKLQAALTIIFADVLGFLGSGLHRRRRAVIPQQEGSQGADLECQDEGRPP